jgi:hypothetical protein
MTERAHPQRQFDTRIAKAMSHHVRVQALGILNERVASPSDIAVELDLPVANVAYHVRTLLQLQCIEEVDVRPVRGALEHRYRATRRVLVKPEEADYVPATARHAIAGEITKAAFGDIHNALASETFDERSNHHLSYTPLILDEQGWETVYAMLNETLERALAEEAASAERLQNGKSGGAEVRSRLSMFHYTAPPSD